MLQVRKVRFRWVKWFVARQVATSKTGIWIQGWEAEVYNLESQGFVLSISVLAQGSQQAAPVGRKSLSSVLQMGPWHPLAFGLFHRHSWSGPDSDCAADYGDVCGWVPRFHTGQHSARYGSALKRGTENQVGLRQSSRCLLSWSCGQVRCNASGPAGRSRNRWAGGRDHQPDRGTGFPLSLEEGVARRVIPGPCKLFLFHFFVATGLRVAFAFLE